ncbi:macro domain protein [Necator americanus]|uniref:Macro domain protein n=1 Tax=Necator americanus TaxID=51031 RepID=W2T9R6_NECAM|nr:macro domain protein [Necator americanus]ETN77951.1 macro domain protein [Necator americanus]
MEFVGGGVDGAIHRAAGTADLQRECRAIGFCDTGKAVITSACKMSHVKNIIHTVGPQCSGNVASVNDREKLVSCYHSCLDLAVKNNLKTIAFCCISTGVYGYPQEDAAKTVVNLLTSWLSKPENAAHIVRIVLVLFNPVDVAAYEKFFEEYAKSQKYITAMPAKIAFNPYDVLELDRQCSEKDIQKAYKQQCLRWHPDKNLDNKEEAERRFIAAKEAFQFLFDKSKREEYDRDYERIKHREATYKARMDRADSVRKKLIDDLHKREQNFVERSKTSEHLTPAQAYQKRKEEERRIRSEFEALRKKLEQEAADEVHAQQERLVRLAREQAEEKKKEEAEERHPTLQVKWKPFEGQDYDEESLRFLYGEYGNILTMTPIRTTKKGERLCMVEFGPELVELGAELEHGKGGPEISGSWIISPQAPIAEEKNPPASEKHSDYSSMTYEQLQEQLFADMGPPSEKRKKWQEEEQ